MTNKSKIIGLIGPKFSGKSTLAHELTIQSNFVRLPFAKHLKDMLRTFLTNQGLSSEAVIEWIDGKWKEEPCPLLNNRTPRHAMQTLGTEWGRNLIHSNLWLDSWLRSVKVLQEKHLNIVCDDVRFINEGETIQKIGGKLVYIERKDAIPSEHISENEFLKLIPDLIIRNPVNLNDNHIEERFGKNCFFDELQSRWHTKFGEYL